MAIARIFVALLAATLMAAAPASAQPGKNKGHGNGGPPGKPQQIERPDQGRSGNSLGDVAITAAEIAIIHDYLGRHRGDLSPELRHAKPLPPGIAMNMARGKPIPPGIAKTRLPDGLLGRLPQYPGYEWTAVGTDILLVSLASGLIADVLHNAF